MYAALTVALNLVVALPGNPDYSSAWGVVASIVIQALLVWRLWRGSEIAWLLGLLLALFAVASTILSGPSYDTGTILFVALSLAQTGILAALANFAWSRAETSAALQ